MSAIPPVPQEIARSVRAVFGSSNFYLLVGDRLPSILAGLHVTGLLAMESAEPPGIPILAFITYFQFAEGLSDVQATDALRYRQEWKYALHLPAIGPYVAEHALCRYRHGLFIDPVALREMEALMFRLHRLRHGPPETSDAAGMLASICSLNRLVWLYHAMDSALEMLARQHPEWLGEMARPYWYTLYRSVAPASGSWANKDVADGLSLTIGADICYLLEKVTADSEGRLARQPELLTLARIWDEQFEKDGTGQIGLRPYCSFCNGGSPGNVYGVLPGLRAGGGGGEKS